MLEVETLLVEGGKYLLHKVLVMFHVEQCMLAGHLCLRRMNS